MYTPDSSEESRSPKECVVGEIGEGIARESRTGKLDTNEEEGWIKELSRVGGTRLPRGHLC